MEQVHAGRRRKEQTVADPTLTDPDKYKVVFENERVRVLEYRDEPGQRTSPHDHPDSVMITLSGFDRRLIGEAGESRDVSLDPGLVRWLDAQTHSGENIGATPTHVLFVELKEPTESEGEVGLGPLIADLAPELRSPPSALSSRRLRTDNYEWSLWSPVVATVGNWSQIQRPPQPQKRCHRLSPVA